MASAAECAQKSRVETAATTARNVAGGRGHWREMLLKRNGAGPSWHEPPFPGPRANCSDCRAARRALQATGGSGSSHRSGPSVFPCLAIPPVWPPIVGATGRRRPMSLFVHAEEPHCLETRSRSHSILPVCWAHRQNRPQSGFQPSLGRFQTPAKTRPTPASVTARGDSKRDPAGREQARLA